MNELTMHGDEGFKPVNFAENINDKSVMFCSLTPVTKEENVFLYNAMNNPTSRLADKINMTISVTDIFCETVECVNEETGEKSICPRVVLIDLESKESYSCVSFGIYSSIKKLIQLFGVPHWDEPLNLIVKQIKKDKKQLLSLELVD